jgi:hypothetical protein
LGFAASHRQARTAHRKASRQKALAKILSAIGAGRCGEEWTFNT